MSLQFVEPSQKSSNVWCRMSHCEWIGHLDITELVEHFELHHPQHLRIIHPDSSYFELSFEDLQTKEHFLLCTNDGTYWFAQNNKKEEGYFSRGLFNIASSKPIKYCIKLGTFSTRIMQIHGPFLSQNERSHQYDFNMQNDYMKYLSAVMTPKVVIYFGEFQEASDEYETCGMDVLPMNVTPENFGYPESFICSGCRKLMEGAPLFCPNRHCLCEHCDRISECARCDTNVFESQSEEIAFGLFCSTYQCLIMHWSSIKWCIDLRS